MAVRPTELRPFPVLSLPVFANEVSHTQFFGGTLGRITSLQGNLRHGFRTFQKMTGTLPKTSQRFPKTTRPFGHVPRPEDDVIGPGPITCRDGNEAKGVEGRPGYDYYNLLIDVSFKRV